MCDECPVKAFCPLPGIIDDIDIIKAEIMEENYLLALILCEIASQNAGKIATSIDEALAKTNDHPVHQKHSTRNNSRDAILWTIMAALFSRSLETKEHGERLKHMTTAIGKKLMLKQKIMDDLELLAVLHDIGKIGVEDRVLNKPGKLTDEEWDLMKKHSEIGYIIVKSAPVFEHIADAVLHHHERWDGTGYPNALRGTEIPLESRILAVADAYDAMTNSRIYHEAISMEAALIEIRRCAGTQFDPDIASLFIELAPSLEDIQGSSE